MNDRTSSRRRRPHRAAVLLLLPLAGCTPVATTTSTPASTTGAGPVYVVASTSSAAEPLSQLPAQVRTTLRAAALRSYTLGGAQVVVLVAGRPGWSLDLTPARGDRVENDPAKRRAAVERQLDRVDAQLRTTPAGVDGLDTFGLADTAARVAHGAPVAVVSSGLSTVDPFDMRHWIPFERWQDVADYVGRLGDLPAHLRGSRLTFYGLGEAAGTQPLLPTSRQVFVRGLYPGVCARVGASCTVADDATSGLPPVAGRAVPRIGIDPIAYPPVPGPRAATTVCTWTTELPSGLMFAPDSAALTAESDEALRPLAERIVQARGRLVVTLVRGHTADAGPGDGVELSQRRAAAVADRLRSLGVPAALIEHVEGVGESDPVVPDHDSRGRLVPSALNRRVSVQTRALDCTAGTA